VVLNRAVSGTVLPILNGLAHEAPRREVERMYLAVLADNAAAVSLYENAGFRAVHEYCYFARGTA
jgi:ribosomal protein S18 acetylase RimI-like enzyme